MHAMTDRITKTPGVCGGDACIRGHRIPVWQMTLRYDRYQTGAGIERAAKLAGEEFLTALSQFADACGIRDEITTVPSEETPVIFFVCSALSSTTSRLNSAQSWVFLPRSSVYHVSRGQPAQVLFCGAGTPGSGTSPLVDAQSGGELESSSYSS